MKTAAEFGYPEVEKQAKMPLKDAAVVNATRWEIWRRLEATGLPVEVGTGGRTKYNRSIRNLPKKKDGTFASPKTVKRVHGFQTGDMVKSAVPKGKFQGTHIGRLASVRASGDFSVKTKSGMVRSNYKYCEVIQHADGYNYTIGNAISL